MNLCPCACPPPAGTSPNLDWMPWHLSQVEAAALSVVHILRFRAELVSETLPAETLAGQPLCMAQYERMYNSCRVPGEECDSIVTYSSDKRHIVVLRNNYILAVEVLDEAGAIKPISDIIRQLEDCIELSSSPFDLESHPPVSVLTSEDRTVWAKVRCEVTQAGCNRLQPPSCPSPHGAQARQHLLDSGEENRASLETVESALFCLALDRESPTSLEDRSAATLLGSGRNRWYDKPFNVITYANGLGSINGEHTWADAMVVVRQQDYVMKSVSQELRTSGKPSRGASASPAYLRPRVLPWKLDATSLQSIELASANFRALSRKFGEWRTPCNEVLLHHGQYKHACRPLPAQSCACYRFRTSGGSFASGSRSRPTSLCRCVGRQGRRSLDSRFNPKLHASSRRWPSSSRTGACTRRLWRLMRRPTRASSTMAALKQVSQAGGG